MLQASVQLYRAAYSGIPRSVWWLSLVIFVNRSGTMVIPFLTVYLTTRGYSLGEAGAVMAVFGCGAFAGGYLGGWLTDRVHFSSVQIASLFCNGLLFIVLGYMKSFWQISGCVLLLSVLGEAFRPANAAAVAAYSNEQNRTRAYSLNRLAINLGWAIGPAVGGVLASIDYNLLFWADGLTCIAAAALLFIVLPPEKQSIKSKDAVHATPTFSKPHTDRVYLKGLFLLLLIVTCFFQLFSIIPVYYKEEVGLSEAVIGIVLALNGLIIATVEMVLVYRLEKQSRDYTYIITGAFLIGVSFLMLAIAPVLSVVLASMLAVTVGEMYLFPFMNNFWIRRSSAGNRGQYAALYTMTFAAAQVAAPNLAAQVVQHGSYTILFVVDFLLCTTACLGFYFLRKQQ
jgi:predicted MFS family arabinose efflux permease